MKVQCVIVGFLMLACGVSAAHADNSNVDGALKDRPDLSIFYKAFTDSGVSHELNENTTYTIFAPTNAAFSRLSREEYPCFYTEECTAQIAEIIRNHIVPGKVYIGDATNEVGGFYTIGRFVNVGELFRNDYAVDSHYPLNMSRFPGGILYEINGVIANPRELGLLHDVGLPPQEVTEVTRNIIRDPRCGPKGCTDELTRTTTITHMVPGPDPEDSDDDDEAPGDVTLSTTSPAP